eukprot:2878372-Alexandrium_andersonii.AAC.1
MSRLRSEIAKVLAPTAAPNRSADLLFLAASAYDCDPYCYVLCARVSAFRRQWYVDEGSRQSIHAIFSHLSQQAHPGCKGNSMEGFSPFGGRNEPIAQWRGEGKQCGPVSLLLYSLACVGCQLDE